jgi:hypothetical protein
VGNIHPSARVQVELADPESVASPALFYSPAEMSMARKRKLYLFQYGHSESYAVSTDKTGCNLPKDGHPWLLRADVLEGHIDAVARKELSEKGYCIIDGGNLQFGRE